MVTPMMTQRGYNHLMEAIGYTWLAWGAEGITDAQRAELYEARVHLANAAMIEMEARKDVQLRQNASSVPREIM